LPGALILRIPSGEISPGSRALVCGRPANRKKGIRRFQPNAEPIGDFDFLGALVGLDFGIARNHFGPAFTQPRNVQDAFDSGPLAMGLKFSHQLITGA